MPSPETTFYRLKRLHVVFALSALAMLATTVWLVWADHRKPWKVYQRTYREQVEPWFTEARLLDEQNTRDKVEQDRPENRQRIERLEQLLARQRPSAGKRIFGLPLLDAFGRPLAVEQIWLPDLTINYHFCRVARFDRCTTCHQGISTAPADPNVPTASTEIVLTLATPAHPLSADGASSDSSDVGEVVQRLYGLVLGARGPLDAAPTIAWVAPQSAAARAELEIGDAILKIDDTPVDGQEQALARLASPPKWGQPLALAIRRGLPQPYAAHPRLDLYVGSQSPHPVASFGCTICHDGQGSATEFRLASHTPNDPATRERWRREHRWFSSPDWDYPMRPGRFTESSCLRCHHDVTDLEAGSRYRDPPAPKLLAGYQLVRQLGCFGCHEIRGLDDRGARIGPDLRLEPSGTGRRKPVSQPGTMRKVGPSLRHVAEKLEGTFIQSFALRPSEFHPQSRMPQLFGMDEHLSPQARDQTRRLESVELRAAAEYLLGASQPSAARPAAPDAAQEPSAERGKRLFQLQGCLACHQHADFPQARATIGPDLSRMGAKLTGPRAAWLERWIVDPAHYSPRTLMPNPLLNETSGNAAAAVPDGAAVAARQPVQPDAAADLAAYLLRPVTWQSSPLPQVTEGDIDELALMHLERSFPPQQAEQYLREGIPQSQAAAIPADARDLLGSPSRQKKLNYLGRRTIAKRGCYGCHDIPGFEEAELIAPALSDWGRKQVSLLAFEEINRYVADTDSARPATDATRAFFREALLAHRREGFIWQKLHEPRSFDYQKDKAFNERLLMGQFTLSDAEIEQVITFVLGLVAEPPAEKYLYHPSPRNQAIIEGRKLIDQFGCARCHTLQMERWAIQFEPGRFPSPAAMEDFAFLKPAITAHQLADSARPDRRGWGMAELAGMPRVDAQGRLVEDEDDDGLPLYFFDLWEPAAIDGKLWPVGGAQVPVGKGQRARVRAPFGGDFARLLFPVALADARQNGSTTSETEAWGWGPPPLVHTGRAADTAWLRQFLLDPTAIRPAAVLRMPKYEMSNEEAGKLAAYLVAIAGAEDPAPPSAVVRRRTTAAEAVPERLHAAMRILTDRKTFCAKCHLIGDYSPGGQIRTTWAPNLEEAGRRLRPDYLRRWLANPKSVRPYTAMPVNFPPSGEPVGQDLYRASSAEQLDAVVDLLVNYEWYLRRTTSIRQRIQAGP